MRLCNFLFAIIGGRSLAAAMNLLATQYFPFDVPNPMLNPTACGRSNVPKSAICDPSLFLTVDSKNVIEGFINNAVGAQIAVAIIDEMSPTFTAVDGDDIPAASERFARTLHNTWGVGDKETNNGILIFLSISDRSVYISTGVGVQSKLTKQFIDYLIGEMRPDLRIKQYGTAIEKTVTQISLILSGKSDIAQRIETGEKNDYSFMIFVFLVGGVVVGIAVVENNKLNQLKKGRKALETFMSEIAEAGENKNFISESCPICLEAFSASKLDATSGDILEGQRVDRTESNVYSSLNNADESEEQNALRKKEGSVGSGSPTSVPKEKDESPSRPMALHCGHVFCYECLSGFLKTRDGTKCPICRAPVSGEKPPTPPPPPPPRPPGAGGGGGGGPGGGGMGSGTSCGSCADTSYSQDSGYTSSSGYHRSESAYSSGQTAEFMYRMQRMNYLYPRVMTGETLMVLNTALSSGSATEFRRAAATRSAEVTRVITDIETRNASSSSGSKGSSYGSFGGGSSGGGGGGSW